MTHASGSTDKPVPGEPGTVAVTVGGRETPASSYRADLAGTPPKLRITDLCIKYVDRSGRETEAVREISLDVADKPGVGEVIVFLGPSGCGKSTILKAVAGLLAPTKGEILVDGQPVTGVGHDQAWWSRPHLGQLAHGPRQRRKRPDAAALRGGWQLMSAKYSRRSGSTAAATKDLSGGMKQRVAIARALINKPRLVLMDEPFGALDPQTRWGMQGLLLDVSKSEDNTILFVTHDVSEAVYLADTVYVLSARPARILHKVDVPFFAVRDIALKSSPEFRAIEKKLLDLLYTVAVPPA
jgi:ABC-type nitrate/sulfonate/bicarbonate transport system ATPase subunit